MLPVLMLCITTFAITLLCHLMSLAGVLLAIPVPLMWLLLLLLVMSFAIAIIRHPARKARADGVTVSLLDAISPFSNWTRSAYVALYGYSLVVTVATVPDSLMQQGSQSMLELLDSPVFLTAFYLTFQSAALMLSHSAWLIQQGRGSVGPSRLGRFY